MKKLVCPHVIGARHGLLVNNRRLSGLSHEDDYRCQSAIAPMSRSCQRSMQVCDQDFPSIATARPSPTSRGSAFEKAVCKTVLPKRRCRGVESERSALSGGEHEVLEEAVDETANLGHVTVLTKVITCLSRDEEGIPAVPDL